MTDDSNLPSAAKRYGPWIAVALVAVVPYLHTYGFGFTNYDDTVTIVESGCCRRCSTNAAISRIVPSTLVLMMDAAESRNDAGWCQSSIFMMPAIAMTG